MKNHREVIFFHRAKSLLSQLHLDSINLALGRLIEAISENTKIQQEAARKPSAQPPSPASVTVDPRSPAEVTIRGETKSKVSVSWDWKDRLRLSVEVLGFLVLCWYACMTRALWKESEKQTAASINATRMSERAWVNVSIDQFTFKAGKPLTIPFRLLNVGPTPALHIYGYVVPVLIDSEKVPDFEYVRTPHNVIRSGFLLPKDTPGSLTYQVFPAGYPPDSVPPAIILTSNQEKQFAEHQMAVKTYGHIWYQDIFGVQHWVKFCETTDIGYKNEAIKSIGCFDYNAVDAEEEYPNKSNPFVPPMPILLPEPPKR